MFNRLVGNRIHKRGLKEGDRVWFDFTNKKVIIRNRQSQFIYWPDGNNFTIFQVKSREEATRSIKLFAYAYGFSAVLTEDKDDIEKLMRFEIQEFEEH